MIDADQHFWKQRRGDNSWPTVAETGYLSEIARHMPLFVALTATDQAQVFGGSAQIFNRLGTP